MKIEISLLKFKKPAIALLVMFISVFVLMILWNWVIISIFDVPFISFWQAFALYLFSSIISKPIKLW